MAQNTSKFNIDPSAATVDVRIIDSTAWISELPVKIFFENTPKGYDELAVPSYSFLIEHPSGRKLLFDLGVRKDWLNFAPAIIDSFKDGPGKIEVKQDVREILEEHGVPGSSIEGIIWSHWHLDHTGDPSTFDSNTALIVGPGFKKALLPGYPANKDAVILESDYEGRELREIEFNQGKKVGRFDAFDYFGDGSFYLLDSPGHAVGHLCGLARVTSSSSSSNPGEKASYIFMGGDASHHPGEFRPSQHLPLPDAISPNPLDVQSLSPCLGTLFEHLLPGGDRTRKFLDVSTVEGGNALDAAEAERTIEKMQEADGQQNVLVVIAHDATLLPILDFFPKYANDFVAKKWVEKGHWAFLKDFKEALE